MTNYNRGLANVSSTRRSIPSRHISCVIQLPVGPVNDVDSFDGDDRLSGSILYDDDEENVPIEQNGPPPATDYETIRRDDKKSRKREVRFNQVFVSFAISMLGSHVETAATATREGREKSANSRGKGTEEESKPNTNRHRTRFTSGFELSKQSTDHYAR